jgi:glutamate synthase domain-containing protein 2
LPPVEIFSLLYKYLDRLAQNGEYVPDVAISGGFTFEDQIFKGLALGAPHFKLVGMARAPLAATMVGKTIGKCIEEEEEVPIYIKQFGDTIEEIFVTASELKRQLGKRFDEIPTGATGLYTYLQRLAQGTRQLMCSSRKFALDYITRDDIAALTKESAEISGISHVMDADREEVNKILGS